MSRDTFLRYLMQKLDDRDATLAGKEHLRNFAWIPAELAHRQVRPEDLFRYLARHTDPSSGSNVREPLRIAGVDPNVVHSHNFDFKFHYAPPGTGRISHAVDPHGAERGVPLPPTVGTVNVTEESDTVSATATVHGLRPNSIDTTSGVGTPTISVSPRPIAMPPGYWMERVAGVAFFFAPKTFRRISEETIADYIHEMIKAEARGDGLRAIRRLRLQHWGGFVIALFDELLTGLVGRIVKALKGG